MKLRAEPYTLEMRHDFKESEKDLRSNLNLDWCDAILFNVTLSYNNLKEWDAQQKYDLARNIARAFGFAKYNFVIVVNGFEPKSEKCKGKVAVISIDRLRDYVLMPDSFKSTLVELDYAEWLLSKYDREENAIEFKKEQVLKELKDLRDKIKQENM